MSVTNNSGATIQGDNGSGINIDAFNGAGALETVTVVNHGMITGNGVTGDGDGVDVDGLVNITNTGTILSKNAVGSASEGSRSVAAQSPTRARSRVARRGQHRRCRPRHHAHRQRPAQRRT